jgi:GntR family transcriptional regulator, rspAB operon transcriptional repressor
MLDGPQVGIPVLTTTFEEIRGDSLVAGYREPALIAQELARAISERIVFLDFEPGSRLTEEEVCAMYGVSRSPVREAFRTIEGEGLVVRHTRRGVRVAPMGRQDLHDVYACRVVLEGVAAREAASHITLQTANRLHTLLDRMAGALRQREIRTFFDHNVAFTRTIHVASKNQTLMRILAGIEKQALRYRYLAHLKSIEMLELSLEGHREVCDAIVQHKPVLAQRRAEQLMRRAHKVIARVVEETYPDTESGSGSMDGT